MPLLFLVITLLLVACGGDKEDGTNGGENNWLKDANLDKTETVDELYEKAKEEGEVVVYSHSSLIADVEENFAEEYPGIKVEGYRLHGVEMLEKIKREYESGVNNADVILAKEMGGAIKNDLLKNGIVHNYKPDDIKEKMIEPYKSSPNLVQFVEYRALFYNTDVYNESPVDNWWDLTTDEWTGRLVIVNPMESSDTMDLFIAMVENADEMAEAYEEKFGEEIELDGTENAGYEFIKQLTGNDLIITTSSSEAVKAVAQSTSDKPPVTIAVSSKLKDVEEQGFSINFSYDIKPRMSVSEESEIYIADGSQNVNAAKLMARWLAGESDGTGQGLHTWSAPGNWHTRDDTTPVDPEQRPLEDLNVWKYNPDFYFEESEKIRDFWLQHQH